MLEPGQYAALKHEAARASLSLGELVRRAVDRTYRPSLRARVRGYEIFFGVWRRPDAAVVGRRVRERP
jgi:hypothetical protein